MPRLLHMADVHLGARHDDLGPAAAAQRERQFEAFRRAVDVALDEKVDVVLICGDLFDSNTQPRRSVERAAAQLHRLVERRVPVVVIPGTHDCYDAGSIYRVFDLAEMAGAPTGTNLVNVLTDTRRSVDFPHLRLKVRSHVFPTKRAPSSPLADMAVNSEELAAPGTDARAPIWQIGMVHGSMAMPGKLDEDEVIFSEQDVAVSALDYLALGHWHSFRSGEAGRTKWAYSGAPEPVAVDQDGAGQVLLVNLDDRNGERQVSVQPHAVGKSKFRKLELDAGTIASQAELEHKLRELANSDLVLDVRLLGVRDELLDLNLDELERSLSGSFLRLRIRDSSIAPLSQETVAPPDTILGALTRDFRARITEHETRGDDEHAAELREALRWGMLLLDDPTRATLP